MTLAGSPDPRLGTEMSELAIIENGALLLHNGLIKEVGPRDEIERQASDVFDVGGRIILPGFIDAHTHPVFGGNRANEFEMRSKGLGYQEIAASGGGIRSSVRATRAATEEELLEQAKRHAIWFLKNGTTTIEAKSGYGLTTEDELKMLRVIQRLGEETPLTCVPTFLGAHSFPDELSREEYVELLLNEMLAAARPFARYCDIFCEQGYYSLEQTRRILGKANELGFALKAHVDQLSNTGAATLVAALGAKTADHLEQTDAEGIEALRRANVTPVLLPASVHCLGLKKYPDARAMIDAGMPVVLATDFNPGSSPTTSMPMVLNLASTQMRMTPAEAITAATINAAFSLNLDHDRGSLESGKRADFVVWDCQDYREIAYWLGASLVHSVYVEGKRVV